MYDIIMLVILIGLTALVLFLIHQCNKEIESRE